MVVTKQELHDLFRYGPYSGYRNYEIPSHRGECVDIINYSTFMKFTKAANLNKRALTIREERAQIGQVAFIKSALPLYRCQNPTTYARLFEEE